jgi:hypothetical protein
VSTPMTPTRTKLTPPELAAQWGIDPAKILTWIRSGELRAIDASTRRGGKPRFLIDLADVAAFEAARAVGPAPKVQRRKRQTAVREYF